MGMHDFLAEKVITSPFLKPRNHLNLLPVIHMLNCMAMRPQQPLNRACVCSLSVCYSVALSVLHARALGGEGAGLMFIITC